MAGKQTSAEKRYAQSEVRRLHNTEDVAGAVDIVDVAEEADRRGTVVVLIEGRVDGDFIDLAFDYRLDGEVRAVDVGIDADVSHAAKSHSLVVAKREIKDIRALGDRERGNEPGA